MQDTSEIEYLWEDDAGNVRLKADLAFLSIYPILPPSTNIDAVSRVIRQVVCEESRQLFGKTPSGGSLNNSAGRWNEFSFIISGHNSISRLRDDIYIVKLASESSIKFWEIYSPEAREAFDSLLKIYHEENIFLRCSTPDFVLVKKGILPRVPQPGPSFIEELGGLYKSIEGRCGAEDVKAFISIKNSTRPDRRYQILYEANVTKFASKYIHSPQNPLRYYAVGEISTEDAQVFKAPLLSSLQASEFSLDSVESPVVDGAIAISTIADLDNFWTRF
jgi:hypothetical protein